MFSFGLLINLLIDTWTLITNKNVTLLELLTMKPPGTWDGLQEVILKTQIADSILSTKLCLNLTKLWLTVLKILVLSWPIK